LNDDDTAVADIKSVFVELLGWEAEDLASPDPAQQIRLLELGVTLEPTWQVEDREGAAQLLIRAEPAGTALDDPVDAAIPGTARQGRPSGDGWTAPPQLRFERLLRETGTPAGLLCTPEVVRLVYAPAGETSGHITFRIADMAQVMGRPILAAFTLLLGEFRMFRAEPAERLTGLLAESRVAQNTVSTRLARQVLGALHALLRGFVATDFRWTGDAAAAAPAGIARLAAEDPQFLYAGLVTVLMRLVFVLYAEDRDLMPADRLYEENYGLRGVFKKLRDDAARHGEDLMDRRYGAWARLLALFRLIHSGGGRASFRFTARKGRLFDPDRFPFLEGRGTAADPVATLPLLSDGTVWRVLERLLVLDGERLSYRTLDVEEIGSVYPAVMGFRIERRPGRALILRSKSHHGAGVIVDIDALFAARPAERKKRLGEFEVAALTGREERAVAEAGTVEALAEALAGKLDADATPALMSAGQPLLQATDERRRSGSHYTPRSLTQPIVAETLRPILERLGPRATPDEILALKVLDPAMGSGAFLVEACRQLAEALVLAWEVHGLRPEVPPDEDALLHAKRLVVQRCLYGVDRNELAAELGKLSLWLATWRATTNSAFSTIASATATRWSGSTGGRSRHCPGHRRPAKRRSTSCTCCCATGSPKSNANANASAPPSMTPMRTSSASSSPAPKARFPSRSLSATRRSPRSSPPTRRGRASRRGSKSVRSSSRPDASGSMAFCPPSIGSAPEHLQSCRSIGRSNSRKSSTATIPASMRSSATRLSPARTRRLRSTPSITSIGSRHCIRARTGIPISSRTSSGALTGFCATAAASAFSRPTRSARATRAPPGSDRSARPAARSTRRAAATNGQARLRSSSRSSTLREATSPILIVSTVGRCLSSPLSCSTTAATTIRSRCVPTQTRALSAATSSAWGSRSTTLTRRALRTRSA
jgi:hypothetical protein